MKNPLMESTKKMDKKNTNTEKKDTIKEILRRQNQINVLQPVSDAFLWLSDISQNKSECISTRDTQLIERKDESF